MHKYFHYHIVLQDLFAQCRRRKREFPKHSAEVEQDLNQVNRREEFRWADSPEIPEERGSLSRAERMKAPDDR